MKTISVLNTNNKPVQYTNLHDIETAPDGTQAAYAIHVKKAEKFAIYREKAGQAWHTAWGGWLDQEQLTEDALNNPSLQDELQSYLTLGIDFLGQKLRKSIAEQQQVLEIFNQGDKHRAINIVSTWSKELSRMREENPI